MCRVCARGEGSATLRLRRTVHPMLQLHRHPQARRHRMGRFATAPTAAPQGVVVAQATKALPTYRGQRALLAHGPRPFKLLTLAAVNRTLT